MHITQDQARSILAWFEAYESELLHTTSGEYRFAERLAQYIGGLDEVAESYRRSAVDEAERETAGILEGHVYEGYNVEFQGARPPRAGEDY
jgi:hypothetical protein